MGGGDIISGNRDCGARDAAAPLMRGGWLSVLCCILRSLRSLESPHTKLKITCHRKIRHHQVHTHTAAVCAHYYPQLCAVAATPAVLANFAFSTTRSRTIPLCSREQLRVSERARRTFVTKSWEWAAEWVRICANAAGGRATSNMRTRFLACCCCPYCWFNFNAPDVTAPCPHQTNCFSIIKRTSAIEVSAHAYTLYLAASSKHVKKWV